MALLDFLNIGTKILDRVIPDPKAKAEAQLELLKLQQSGELTELQLQMSAILAEAQSGDKWTSRARPGFLYVMYVMMLWALPFSIFWAFYPDRAALMSAGLQHWLGAIPESLYALFGAGYLGYSASRSYDKKNGVTK